MSKGFDKWITTIGYAWTKHLAYRINFFLEITGPVLVFFFVSYNLWTSIYGGDENLVIKGYNYKQMISYHGWGLIVGMLARGHMSSNLAEDIRLGRISSYLVYPFNFWEYQTASFIGFQFIQLLSCMLALSCLWYFGVIEITTVSTLAIGIFYCIYVSFFWFLAQYAIGLLSFWLDETWILRVIFMLISGFLAGSYFPLDLYPEWLQVILDYLPFSYIQYYPVKILMGETHLFGKAIFMISAWMVPLAFLVSFVWRRGLRRYTAAGM